MKKRTIVEKRPGGVIVIGAVLLVAAIIFTLICIGLSVYTFIFYKISLTPNNDPCASGAQENIAMASIALTISIILTAILWFIGIGILRLKKIARKIAIFFAYIYGVILLALLLKPTGFPLWHHFLDIKVLFLVCLSLVLFFSARYLSRSEIKKQFI